MRKMLTIAEMAHKVQAAQDRERVWLEKEFGDEPREAAEQHVQEDVLDGPPEPMSAEEGIDARDTSFLYPEHDDCHDTANDMDTNDNEHNNDAGPDVDLSGDMVDMLTLMDTLRGLGVNVVDANRSVASVVRTKPSLMDFCGRGNIVNLANEKLRDLNILGDTAFDLRTLKPASVPLN